MFFAKLSRTLSARTREGHDLYQRTSRGGVGKILLIQVQADCANGIALTAASRRPGGDKAAVPLSDLDLIPVASGMVV
jgi:hypothetical protein